MKKSINKLKCLFHHEWVELDSAYEFQIIKYVEEKLLKKSKYKNTGSMRVYKHRKCMCCGKVDNRINKYIEWYIKEKFFQSKEPVGLEVKVDVDIKFQKRF
jgi:hypothetical protein